MKPPTVYLRKEPTTDRPDPAFAAACPGVRRWLDVVAYRDPDASACICRWPWYRSKPDRRNRWITLNCYRWRVIWLPDLSA